LAERDNRREWEFPVFRAIGQEISREDFNFFVNIYWNLDREERREF
jgi:hypothetical protein